MPRRRGFTLIELLVVIAIIGVLIAMLLPAIQSAREAGRGAVCRSNLHNLGLALANYNDAHGMLPMSGDLWLNPLTGKYGPGGVWGIHARLLPFVEAQAVYEGLNFARPSGDATNNTAKARLGGVFTCPSDTHAQARRIDIPSDNVNYGYNRGAWYVFGGTASAQRPASPFQVNASSKLRDVTDGLTKTLFVAEVKTAFSYIRKCDNLLYAPVNATPIPAADADPATVPQYFGSCSPGEYKQTAHTEWYNAAVHHSGFTTSWTPNRKTAGTFAGITYPDADLDGTREQDGGPTFSAITARSFHPGGVNVCLGDASVQFIGDSVSAFVWRALGTPAGGEANADF